jgi:SAM-dependent methyltransferase
MPYRVIVVTDPYGTDQMQLDARNAAFWDELCGSSLAKSLGIDSIDRTSLRRFDVAYMTLYPYLSDYLELDRLRGERVLEIGLGFGTVSQLLAASGAVYHGVDIAPGPVETVRSRLKLEGLPGVERVVQASVLGLPYGGCSFDRVVAIGCLHHTGDLARSISEVHRVLAPRGRAVVMIYNSQSLRLYRERLRGLLRRKRRDEEAERLRSLYDVNLTGEAAPHTDYTSRPEARRLFGKFSSVRVEVRNCDPMRFGPIVVPREWLLQNVARVLGTDLYVVADKG